MGMPQVVGGPSVEAECEQCGFCIEVPGAVIRVVWNCPSCHKHNDAPVGSAKYQQERR